MLVVVTGSVAELAYLTVEPVRLASRKLPSEVRSMEIASGLTVALLTRPVSSSLWVRMVGLRVSVKENADFPLLENEEIVLLSSCSRLEDTRVLISNGQCMSLNTARRCFSHDP